MLKTKRLARIIIMLLLLPAMLVSASCARIGASINPGDWGYDSVVTYHALGGMVNAREVRTTYYMDNSYLFEPAGTTNMLIRPVKDGYVLAGWYTAKEDVYDDDGNLVDYLFRSEDRWDFNLDRVQGDLTLYARWVRQARVEYIDAATGDVMFAKNITADSPIQPLSGAAENLIQKEGYTLMGYFEDEACTIPYDFSAYVHAEIRPTNVQLYTRLQEEFPQYIVPYEYVEPVIDPADEEAGLVTANPDHYLNLLGYDITTDDAAVRAQIRARKDEIIDQAIEYYIENTADRNVYLKYIEGNFLRVSDPSHLRQGNSYSFAAGGADGIIILADLDFAGLDFAASESFSGRIYGNGFTLSNIELNITGRRADMATERDAGLFLQLDNAWISDITFDNLTINTNFRTGIDVTIGAFAVEATASRLENIAFRDLTINSGNGDDGEADYLIYDFIARSSRNQVEQITGENVIINSSDFARIHSLFIIPDPEEPEEPENGETEVTEETESTG